MKNSNSLSWLCFFWLINFLSYAGFIDVKPELIVDSKPKINPSHNFISMQHLADKKIIALYSKLNTMQQLSLAERIAWVSQLFLGSIYERNALGEGFSAKYDQYPQYRLDAFDCDTYVNTMISLAIANSLEDFKKQIKLIRYKDGKVSYINRNHFTALDWNLNNQRRGVLKDITQEIKNKNQQTIAKEASALVNKPSWYAHKPLSTIRILREQKLPENSKLLTNLKQKGQRLEIATEKVAYIPLSALFKDKQQPDFFLFDQIPHGAIIEIIRPNWDLRKEIGTALNVSHLGFAIRKNQQLLFRQASSSYKKIVDVPLIEYLQKLQTSPTIKGINIQIVLFQIKTLRNIK